jgi:hypothetical protein
MQTTIICLSFEFYRTLFEIHFISSLNRNIFRFETKMNGSETTPDSNIKFSSTIDPDIGEVIKGLNNCLIFIKFYNSFQLKDGFFLSIVVLLFIYVLKLIYISMIMFTVMTASDDTSIRQYPGGCNLCCDIIGTVIMIGFISFGIWSITGTKKQFYLPIIYLTAIGGALVSDFISLISICNSCLYSIESQFVFMTKHLSNSESYGIYSELWLDFDGNGYHRKFVSKCRLFSRLRRLSHMEVR